MKRKFIFLIMVAAIGFVMCCGCSTKIETEPAQVWHATYAIESNYVANINTPAPADKKTYSYDGYHTFVSFVKTADAHDSFEEEAVEVARLDTFGEFDEWGETLRNEKNFKIEGLPAYKAECEWNIGDDITNLYRSYVTAIKVEDGVYVFNTYYYNDESKFAADKHHKNLVRSIEMTEADDPEVFAEDIGQVDNFLFSAPGWDQRLVNGDVVAYLKEQGDSYYMMVKSVDELDVTEENMTDIVQSIYGVAVEDVELIGQKNPEDTITGTAIQANFNLKMSYGEMKTSALFVTDYRNKIIACFMIPYDAELKGDYQDIINSVQYNEPHLVQLENLWDYRTEYVGDNDNVVALASEAGFWAYGNEYTVELDTDKPPYGMTINITTDTQVKSFERKCTLLLGLIDNLDYVKVVTPNDTFMLTVEDTETNLTFDVKELGKSKPLLEEYLLKTHFSANDNHAQNSSYQKELGLEHKASDK